MIALLLLALASTPTFGAAEGGASVLLSNADGASPYNGVVRYFGRTQCTGVFIEAPVGRDASASAPAYVLTNGHCADFPGANDVLVNLVAPTTHRVVFDYFADTQTRQVSVPVSRIAYVTMKGRDLAVLELGVPFAEVVRWGYVPRSLSLTVPVHNEPVVVVGAPLTGVAATSFLRLASCRLESKAPVVMEYVWHWFDMDRHRCADVVGGSSGSPVISTQTDRVVGLVNTTTTGAVPFTECVLNHPCEPVAGGAVGQMSTSYMTPLAGVGNCFDESGVFDLTSDACPLETHRQLFPIPGFLGAVNPALAAPILGQPKRRWDVAISGPFDYYAYKVVDPTTGDCRDPRGYSQTRLVQSRPVIDDALPAAEGFHFLCVIGATFVGRGVVWQDIRHPSIVAVRIDTVAPQLPARIVVEPGPLGWRVVFNGLDPELSLYTFKFGRPADTRCTDPANYRLALVPFIFLPVENRPYVFCAIPHDAALNPGAVFEVLLP